MAKQKPQQGFCPTCHQLVMQPSAPTGCSHLRCKARATHILVIGNRHSIFGNFCQKHIGAAVAAVCGGRKKSKWPCLVEPIKAKPAKQKGEKVPPICIICKAPATKFSPAGDIRNACFFWCDAHGTSNQHGTPTTGLTSPIPQPRTTHG